MSFRRFAAPFWLLGCFAALPSSARAEPYLAVRYGYKCSQCHLNPTGGGKRNSFGNIFTQTELPWRTLSARDLAAIVQPAVLDGGEPSDGEKTAAGSPAAPQDDGPGSTFYTGYLTRFLSLGGDVRFNNQTVARGEERTTTNTFSVAEGNLYASIELFSNVLSLYLDETMAPGGAASREAYALLRGPWASYVKAGRMMLPFGWRLQDDSAFIREITGFNYGVQDLGVEFGLEPGPISASIAVSNGTQGSTDDNRDKQVSAILAFIRRYWRIGAHATWNNTPQSKRIAAGAFAGLTFGRFTVLGEADRIVDEQEAVAGEPTERKLLLYGAVTYLLARGVNLQFTYDFADPNTAETEDSFIRLSAGVEFFATQFTQLRAFYRFRDDTEDSIRDDESIIDFELHIFF